MIKTFLILTILTAAKLCSAQQCQLNDLSNKFNYSVSVVKAKDADGDLRVSEIRVKISGKTGRKKFQRIVIKAGLLFSDAFTDCSAVKSFVTGKNTKTQIVDNDYGDFITADFNFDNREDFAVKRDSGGNGGAFYVYYTQNKIGKFEKDSFLTDTIGYFPGTIDVGKKRLVTYIHANAQGYNENVYQYNAVKKRWKYLSQTYHLAGQ